MKVKFSIDDYSGTIEDVESIEQAKAQVEKLYGRSKAEVYNFEVCKQN